MTRPRLLDVFCGVGGWSKAFNVRGWDCTGVDLVDLAYPYRLVIQDALTLDPAWIASFDGVVMSPPCDDFARAWLPWLRGDKRPDDVSLSLLAWSVALCDRPRRLCECSNFAGRHEKGGVRIGSYTLWGDVPLLISEFPRSKMAKSGMRPDLRAEIPLPLADAVADHFTAQLP